MFAPFRSSTLAVAAIGAMSVSLFVTPIVAQEEKAVELDAEEVKLLKDVMSRDKFLKELVNLNAGLESLNKVFGVVTPGPLKLSYKWHAATFKAWGKANKSLAVIGKRRICDDLMFPIINQSANAELFERMREVRGCDE